MHQSFVRYQIFVVQSGVAAAIKKKGGQDGKNETSGKFCNLRRAVIDTAEF